MRRPARTLLVLLLLSLSVGCVRVLESSRILLGPSVAVKAAVRTDTDADGRPEVVLVVETPVAVGGLRRGAAAFVRVFEAVPEGSGYGLVWSSEPLVRASSDGLMRPLRLDRAEERGKGVLFSGPDADLFLVREGGVYGLVPAGEVVVSRGEEEDVARHLGFRPDAMVWFRSDRHGLVVVTLRPGRMEFWRMGSSGGLVRRGSVRVEGGRGLFLGDVSDGSVEVLVAVEGALRLFRVRSL